MPFAHTQLFLAYSFICLSKFIVVGAVENGVIGEPRVDCGVESINVWIRTEKLFQGRLYAEEELEHPECVHTYSGATAGSPDRSLGAEFNIRFGQCNMRRQRVLNPRGVSYSFTLVISFHPVFLTGVDKAFNIKCFFLEAVKAVDTSLDVSPLNTHVVEQEFTLPQCTYHLKQSYDGPFLKFANIGEPITHVWSCDGSAGTLYGVLIHSCYVDDGRGNRFDLMDDRGYLDHKKFVFVSPSVRWPNWCECTCTKGMKKQACIHAIMIMEKEGLIVYPEEAKTRRLECERKIGRPAAARSALQRENLGCAKDKYLLNEVPPSCSQPKSSASSIDFPPQISSHRHQPPPGVSAEKNMLRKLNRRPSTSSSKTSSASMPQFFNHEFPYNKPFKDSPLNGNDTEEILNTSTRASRDAIKSMENDLCTDLSIDLTVLPLHQSVASSFDAEQLKEDQREFQFSTCVSTFNVFCIALASLIALLTTAFLSMVCVTRCNKPREIRRIHFMGRAC